MWLVVEFSWEGCWAEGLSSLLSGGNITLSSLSPSSNPGREGVRAYNLQSYVMESLGWQLVFFALFCWFTSSHSLAVGWDKGRNTRGKDHWGPFWRRSCFHDSLILVLSRCLTSQPPWSITKQWDKQQIILKSPLSSEISYESVIQKPHQNQPLCRFGKCLLFVVDYYRLHSNYQRHLYLSKLTLCPHVHKLLIECNCVISDILFYKYLPRQMSPFLTQTSSFLISGNIFGWRW